MNIECPTSELMKDYLAGRVADRLFDDMSGHIDSCDLCQGLVSRLESSEDLLFARLRRLAGSQIDEEDQELEQLLARAQRIAEMPSTEDFRGGGQDHTPETIGDYVVLSHLGAGAFGSVYLCKSPLLERQVAIKLLKIKFDKDSRARDRFLRELRAIGKLPAHKAVVQAFQASEQKGQLYLVMEHVDGTDLNKLVKHNGPLCPAAAADAVRQAALGLQFIHEHGLVHRDVKPANLMLGKNGTVQILDWGLALLVDEENEESRLTETGMFIGTRDFASPEQCENARLVDIRADIYSLGCTLYFLLTGHTPFERMSPSAKLNAHRFHDPTPLSHYRVIAPEGLELVIRRAMAKMPEDRYQTPEEFAKALDRFVEVPQTPSTTASAKRRFDLYRSIPKDYFLGCLACILLSAIVLCTTWNSGVPAQAGPLLSIWGHEKQPLHLAFGTARDTAISVDSSSIYLWNLGTGQRRAACELQNNSLIPAGLAQSAGSRNVLLALYDQTGYRMERRDSISGTLVGTPSIVAGKLACFFSTSDGGESFTAETSGNIRLWKNDKAGEVLKVVDGDVVCGTASTDGEDILLGCKDGCLILLKRKGGGMRHYRGIATVVPQLSAVGLCGMSQTLVAVDKGLATAMTWDRESGEIKTVVELQMKHRNMVCAAVAPNDSVLAGYDDGSVVLWNLANGRLVAEYRRHTGPVGVVALSSDGKRALSAGTNDLLVWLYSLPPLNEVASPI